MSALYLFFYSAINLRLKPIRSSRSVFFANSLFWRFHINSGQIYIIYTFLLALAWLALKKLPKFNYLTSGFVIGITSTLRPPFILLFIPFLIYRKYSFLLGGILGLLFGLSLSLMVVDIFIWKRYVLAMLGMTKFINLKDFLLIENRTINSTDIVYPQIIEGFDAIANPLINGNFSNSSVYKILSSLAVPNVRGILVLGFVTTIVFLAFYLIKYNSKKKDINFIFLFGILMCLIGEFFIPIGRYSYYDVQLMLPLYIIITQANIKQLIHSKSLAILLLGLLLSLGCFNWIPKFLTLSTYLIIFYITRTSLMFLKQQN